MLVSERRAALVDLVRRQGSARVEDLAVELRVSGMTVRRDVEDLAREGLLVRVRGGVTLPLTPPSGSRPGVDDARARQRREKEAVAARAALLVEPGMTVGLSAGSTTWYLARHLRHVPGLTVVTTSLPVAEAFDEAPRAADEGASAVVLTGGVRTAAGALVGPVAVRTLQTLHCDLVVVGAHGLDPAAGVTMPNLLQAETDRALLATGARTVVVADHTKWRTVSLTTVVDLDELDVAVVDDRLDAAAAAELREHVGDLLLAPGA